MERNVKFHGIFRDRFAGISKIFSNMLHIRFLVNFAVFCMFLWISQNFLDLPEFHSSTTAWNIRSPIIIIIIRTHHTYRIISSCRCYNVLPWSSPHKSPFEIRTLNSDSNPTTTKTGHTCTPTSHIYAFIQSMHRTQIIFLQGYILWYDYIFFCPFD